MAVSDLKWQALLKAVLVLHLHYLHNPFVQACGGTFTGSRGVITSPSYPQSYPDNLTCVYTIIQPDWLPVSLVFEDFNTEGIFCSYDYVEVRDGNSATSPLLTPRLCGSVLPPILCSSQRYMRLLFKTDYSIHYKGFNATYSVCGGNFTASSGIIQSPSYPNNYPNNIDYSYVINQTDGYFIYLNFMDFFLEDSSTCTSDYVEIRNGGTIISPILGNRLCGSLLPPVQRTTTNLMWIRFKTNGAVTRTGFQASYTTCGGKFTSAQGYVQSPSYPSNYPSNMDCVYVISMPDGYRINISFSSFSLQGGSSCLNDYLEIRDGGSQLSPILGQRLCGTTMPSSQTTSKNIAWIHFKSDNSTNYQGFRFAYISSCVEYYSGKQGVIQSPSFPYNYPHNIDCVYVISQQSEYLIYLIFTDFKLENGSKCLEDYVEVRDGGSASSPLIGNRFCGSIIPPIMKSTQNIMRIRFKTNYDLTYSGFKALYHVESNSNTSNDNTIVIGAICGVAALAIIIIVSLIVVIKWRKAKGMTNRNTQPTITVNTTYDGLNRDKNGTSRAEGESSVYATIEEHRAETHQIDNPAYSGNIG